MSSSSHQSLQRGKMPSTAFARRKGRKSVGTTADSPSSGGSEASTKTQAAARPPSRSTTRGTNAERRNAHVHTRLAQVIGYPPPGGGTDRRLYINKTTVLSWSLGLTMRRTCSRRLWV